LDESSRRSSQINRYPNQQEQRSREKDALDPLQADHLGPGASFELADDGVNLEEERWRSGP
jgi:hypothetical protein